MSELALARAIPDPPVLLLDDRPQPWTRKRQVGEDAIHGLRSAKRAIIVAPTISPSKSWQ
jgi:hypothetical protein